MFPTLAVKGVSVRYPLRYRRGEKKYRAIDGCCVHNTRHTLYCIVLGCLYCVVLRCLYCIVLHCIAVLYSIVSYCIVVLCCNVPGIV